MERVIEVFVELDGTSQFVGRLPGKPLFKAIGDSAPDRWGRTCKSDGNGV